MYEFNGMRVLCDWLAFTMSEVDKYGCMELFGFSLDDFKVMPHGARGYNSLYRHVSQEISIYAEGSENMGVHVEVKGSAMYFFLESFQKSRMESTPFGDGYQVDDIDEVGDILRSLYRVILNGGWFTRMDIAIDDLGCSYFSCDEVTKLLKKELYVSNFRKWEIDMTYEKGGDGIGYTIYMGSRKASQMFLRVYDKKLEQKAKKDIEDLPDWVRWELELKDERADEFAKYVERGQDFGIVAMSVLNNYLRFINRDNENVSRCSTLKKWDRFVNHVGRLKLSSPRGEKSVEKSREWIDRQCMPTIAGLVMANGGSVDFLTNHLYDHYERLKPRDKRMFEEYQNNDK